LPRGQRRGSVNAGNSTGHWNKQKVAGTNVAGKDGGNSQSPDAAATKDLSSRKQVTIPEWMKRK
jgi:hypothetical protein